MHNFRKGSASVVMAVIITVLVIAVGYLFIKQMKPVVPDQTATTTLPAVTSSTGVQTPAPQKTSALFSGFTQWQTSTKSSWQDTQNFYDPSVSVASLPIGTVTTYRHEYFFDGSSEDTSFAEQKTLETRIKNTLNRDGWVQVSHPQEASGYMAYLFRKGNRYLILSNGTRAAVQGGLYTALQFQD